MSGRLPCPEGFCVVPDCGKLLRADTWAEICDGHWQMVPLDLKRLLMKFGRSSARSAAPDPKKRQPLEYRQAMTQALDHIAQHVKGYTGSMSRSITDRDLNS